ncbi:MAG: AMP-binding protein [Actinobacteria bacterium]|nr:AMP-binding protein [Actinomycetota bacterium]
MTWNYGVLWKGIAEVDPGRPALMHGELVRSWGEFHSRSNALAADMLAAGLGPDSKVAQYLYNCPEYSESIFASFLSGFVPVNTNYRYGPEEIVYLFDNADAEAVVFHGVFAKLIDGVRGRLPQVKRWYMVADEVTEVPGWAVDYEAVVAVPVADIVPPRALSGDDMLFLYTGGTTGMPKGVMWRLDDLAAVLGFGANPLMGVPPAESVAEIIARVETGGEGPRSLVCCPLMHGTGQFSSFINFANAGCVITLPNRNLDPGVIWSTTQNRRVNTIVVVGQAFTGPMLDHLNDNPGAYDLSSVVQMGSSGVMWSQENKEGLLEHIPQMVITDSFGSSEAVGMGASVSTKGAPAKTAQFALGPNCVVFTEDGRRVEPGSGERGLVAVGGAIPLGYYKDEAKTAATFRTFEGRRWTVPGDWAEVNPDGTLHLLGRGSVCINTGGEKVFPEEVEETLKRHPAVRDAVAVGIPDPRWVETICAVVETEGAVSPTLEELSEHVKSHLAAYKSPRHLVIVPTIGRAPNGKVDYKRLKQHAMDTLGVK